MSDNLDNLDDLMKELPPRQQFFVREYLANGQVASRAYVSAGYKASTPQTAEVSACKLLRVAKVAACIQLAMDRRAKKLDITAEYVLKNIVTIGERCMQVEPVYDKEGNPTGEYTFNANGALKAQELLGRNLKLFVDRIEVTDATSLAERLNKARQRVKNG